MAFLRRCPELVRTSAWRARDSSSRSMRTMMSRTASAPMPAQKMRPVLAPEPYFSSSWRNSVSPMVVRALSASISSRARLSSSFWPEASLDSCSRSTRSASSMADWRSSTFCSVMRSSSDARWASSSVTRSVSAVAILRSRLRASLPPLSPAATTTSPVGANAIVSSAAPVPSSLSWASTACASRATSSMRALRCASSSDFVRGQAGPQLVGLAADVRLQRRLELGEPLAAGAAAALRLLLERAQRALAGLLVDVGDDVQGEVQDPLEVAGADVEQDAEPAGRALEVPDVADRARQLDVAHALTADLRAGDLDAALVADDALVADALVLPAVALPVPGGTEDALVEEPVLLRLERAVVDGLGLRHLALRPLPDLVRAGERDSDRREVVDLEHRSPLRRRGQAARLCVFSEAGPGRPDAGPILWPMASGASPRPSERSCQSSNPARLIPPRSGSR